MIFKHLLTYRLLKCFENRCIKTSCFYAPILSLALSCLCSTSLSAQTPSSDNILYVKQGSTGNGSSWANALGELSEALSWAHNDWDTHTDGTLQIWVATGKYLPTNNTTDRNAVFRLTNGVKVYGGFSGAESALTERDRSKNVTILSGDIDHNDETTVIMDTDKEIKGNNSYTIVDGSDTDITAVLDGFIITAGNANNNAGGNQTPSNSGGGIYLNKGSPTLANLIITGNRAVYGGGIYNWESSPNLTGVNISNNKAGSGNGDGILYENDSRPELTNVVISGKWDNAAGDYTITFSNDDISPILTVVTHPNQGKVYGTDEPILTYTASGFLHGDNHTVLSGTLLREAGEDAGNYRINQGTLSATDYTFSFVGADFAIAKSPQEISFMAPEELSIHLGPQSLTVSASSRLPATLKVDDSSIASLTGTTLHLHKTGTITVTAFQNGNDNYEEAIPVSQTIRIIESPTGNIPLRVRKVLSPNGDGINDFLFIEGIERFPDNKLLVFDQSGTILTQIKGYNNGTITFTGKGLKNGTYFYYLDLTMDGKQKRIKGFFELRRN